MKVLKCSQRCATWHVTHVTWKLPEQMAHCKSIQSWFFYELSYLFPHTNTVKLHPWLVKLILNHKHKAGHILVPSLYIYFRCREPLRFPSTVFSRFNTSDKYQRTVCAEHRQRNIQIGIAFQGTIGCYKSAWYDFKSVNTHIITNWY